MLPGACGRAGVGWGEMGVGQAKESQRRPLLASPDVATGSGEMMDAQRAGRRQRYAGAGGAGRRRTHLFHSRLKVEVTGLFQVQPNHRHAGHSLHGGYRPPASRPLP